MSYESFKIRQLTHNSNDAIDELKATIKRKLDMSYLLVLDHINFKGLK